MKKVIYFFSICALLAYSAATAKNLKAILSYNTFYSPDKGPYVETYLSVSGKSVNYVKVADGKFQAKIEVTLLFKLKDETKYFDKYNLLSPELEDTNHIAFNFIDQQRVQLDNGRYVFELAIADKNSTSEAFKSSQVLSVEYYPNIVSVSDIQLIDSYKKSEMKSMLTKNGFEMVPFVNNYYSPDVNSLKFYAEVYNANKVLGTDPFLITYHIETYENKRILENFRGFKKQESNSMNAIISEFPINNLPSGNYNLVVEARNKKNEIIAFKEAFFQRNNGASAMVAEGEDFRQLDISNTFAALVTNRDTLIDNIKSLRPISNSNEAIFVDNQLKTSDIKTLQQYLYDFWQKREPENPEKAWMAYSEQVKIVNTKFSALNKRGYETERGRVFLKYGPPNVLQAEYREPSAYPYEIWQYYKINNQSNRKFVFYNRDLVSNDFALLHSDALGEPYEDQWQIILHSRDTQTNDFDRKSSVEGYGENASQNFKNPR